MLEIEHAGHKGLVLNVEPSPDNKYQFVTIMTPDAQFVELLIANDDARELKIIN